MVSKTISEKNLWTNNMFSFDFFENFQRKNLKNLCYSNNIFEKIICFLENYGVETFEIDLSGNVFFNQKKFFDLFFSFFKWFIS